MILYAALGGLVIAGAAGLGGYLHGVEVTRDKMTAEQAKIEDVARLASEAVANQSATAISALQVKETTIYQKATHEIRTNTVYADCRHTPGVLLDTNEALTGKRPPAPNTGAGVGKLPNANPPDGSIIRLHDGKADRLGLHVSPVPKSNRAP